MRAFVELRRVAGSYAEIESRIEQIEREMGERLDDHDEQLTQVFEALRRLIAPPAKPRRPVGFRLPEDTEGA